MDGWMYCDILSSELKRSVAKLHKKDKIIDQQDLGTWHAFSMVNTKMKKIKLKVFDWSAKSSDLNPIELVWSILDELALNYCSLVDSMPEKLKSACNRKMDISITFQWFFFVKKEADIFSCS